MIYVIESNMCVLSHVQLFWTSWTVACQAPLSMEPSSKDTGVGCHFLLQQIFPTQRYNPCLLFLLHCREILYYLSHRGSPIEFKVKVKVAQSCLTLCNSMDYTVHGILQARILEWVAFPFSRGSSQCRDRTQVSCIAGGFFTS